MSTNRHTIVRYGYPLFVEPLPPANLPVRRCPVPYEDAAIRILVMRTGAHGDIVMGTPLLTALRDHYPNAHLTWLVEHTETQAIDAHPCIDQLLVWNSLFWKRMLRRGNTVGWLQNALRLRRDLHRRRFDVFISLLGEEWPLLTRHIGADTRIGIFNTFKQHDRPKITGGSPQLFTQAFTQPGLPLHRADQYLLPLQTLGIPPPANRQMQMGYTVGDAAHVDAILRKNGISDTFVVLAPMTTWVSRCWPADRFVALGNALQDAGIGIVCIGSAREKEPIEAIAREMTHPPLTLTGALGFREAAALIARARVLVSGDTGPMHVAAAVETPYVALFGPTPVAGRAPFSGRGTVLMHPISCSPCDQKVCPNPPEEYMRCMNLITAEEAYTAVRTLITV